MFPSSGPPILGQLPHQAGLTPHGTAPALPTSTETRNEDMAAHVAAVSVKISSSEKFPDVYKKANDVGEVLFVSFRQQELRVTICFEQQVHAASLLQLSKTTEQDAGAHGIEAVYPTTPENSDLSSYHVVSNVGLNCIRPGFDMDSQLKLTEELLSGTSGSVRHVLWKETPVGTFGLVFFSSTTKLQEACNSKQHNLAPVRLSKIWNTFEAFRRGDSHALDSVLTDEGVPKATSPTHREQAQALPSQQPSLLPAAIPSLSAPHVPLEWQGRHPHLPSAAPGFMHPGVSTGLLSFGLAGSDSSRPSSLPQLSSMSDAMASVIQPSGGSFPAMSPMPQAMGGAGAMGSSGLGRLGPPPPAAPRQFVPTRQSQGEHSENPNRIVIADLQSGQETRTTVMLRNVPADYTQSRLLEEVNMTHRGTFDFFYLPFCFKSHRPYGYAFVNFTSPEHVMSFYAAFNRRRWLYTASKSADPCTLSFARIQGIRNLIERFRTSSIMAHKPEFRPLFLLDRSQR